MHTAVNWLVIPGWGKVVYFFVKKCTGSLNRWFIFIVDCTAGLWPDDHRPIFLCF